MDSQLNVTEKPGLSKNIFHEEKYTHWVVKRHAGFLQIRYGQVFTPSGWVTRATQEYVITVYTHYIIIIITIIKKIKTNLIQYE